MPASLLVNGRRYAWPEAPTVVVCVDGCEPAYVEEAAAAGFMPFMAEMTAKGADLRAHSVVPSFTNPNNISIVTGVPPAVHGICGNYFLDPSTGEEIMMNDPRLLRAGSIPAAFAEAGAKVAVVTAKDKLRGLLGHGMSFGPDGAVCFSSEKADQATLADNGIEGILDLVGMPLPSVYSAELSEFVLAAGVRLLETRRPDLMYLSTTDYIQHKHAPGTPTANGFYAMLDRHLARMDDLGARIALTADHGMKPKHDEAGRANVIYLQPLLDGWLGGPAARVILPITDPYVVHHGALGGFAVIYLGEPSRTSEIACKLSAVPGIDHVFGREEACAVFGLPPDREGDLIVISSSAWTLGTRPERHDLSQLKEPLRSHGGMSEQTVPLILNHPCAIPPSARTPRNFDAFCLALNGHLD